MAVILFRFPLTHNGPFYRYGANEYVFAPYSSIIAVWNNGIQMAALLVKTSIAL